MQGNTKPHGVTPSQTVGPFFKYGLTPNGAYEWNDAFTNNLVTPDTSGDRIRVEGRVFDGDGQPVPDAMLEFWSDTTVARGFDADDEPRDFPVGFRRAVTDADGAYSIVIERPSTELHEGAHTPHIDRKSVV